MTLLSTTVSAHLIAASEIIHRTARDTVKATPNAREALAHIDAAQAFLTAADALYEAAERVAAGEPVGTAWLALSLRVAEAKAAEGRAMLEGAGKVGASVPLLEQMLDADELRIARRATLSNARDEMARLGQVAVDRLAQMPTADPETFREMVEGMDPKARKMIRHDRNSGQWIVSLPGHPDMSYGAAVRLGLVKV